MGIVKNNIDKIIQLCSSHEVDKLYLFGSAETDAFTESSDVDLLVSFRKFDLGRYFENYMDFKNKLEGLLKRKVDLVEEQTLKNPVLIRSIERTKQLIYG
ncbi:nucleotidyltransferase family protein [Algoriphagus sp. PAP.12]|uniref:nucleotidyltransferase family protein n=1 Tax=Algoriphagus sp. PAP.12 TaxID=2996678 RepID=UPI00227A2BAB|nr:nucleotidyltransferase domain-containing protein [Algoriphagus sp. PAP.12]